MVVSGRCQREFTKPGLSNCAIGGKDMVCFVFLYIALADDKPQGLRAQRRQWRVLCFLFVALSLALDHRYFYIDSRAMIVLL